MRMRTSDGPLAPGLQFAAMNHFPTASPLDPGSMDRLFAAKAMLRSTGIVAFLTAVLLGCGNASARAVQQTEGVEQDWEVQPALWSPRPILIPRTSGRHRHPDG
jgi:hypothetical protein